MTYLILSNYWIILYQQINLKIFTNVRYLCIGATIFLKNVHPFLPYVFFRQDLYLFPVLILSWQTFVAIPMKAVLVMFRFSYLQVGTEPKSFGAIGPITKMAIVYSRLVKI